MMNLSAVHGVARTGAGSNQTGPEPRLVRAAHQFEAMMMKELLAPMSRASLQGDGEETGILGEFASESLAGALSAGGGLGMADRIVGALSHSGNHPGTIPVTGKPEKNNGMSAGQ
jgi:Rod binding domain-containing protein